MPFVKSFAAYLPELRVDNETMAARLGCDPDWIFKASGIRERRFASDEESVIDLGVNAAKQCLTSGATPPCDVGMVLVASGTPDRIFPGPACQIAYRLGLAGKPAIDVPIASAGSLFALALARTLAPDYRRVLVVAAEKMSRIVLHGELQPSAAMLFGDGAAACLIDATGGIANLVDCVLYSDGTYSKDLSLDLSSVLRMNGRAIILQAARKLPEAIGALLTRNQLYPREVDTYLLHQANQNLTIRVAQALGVPETKFYSNIAKYGNTSSASMLIAAHDWCAEKGFQPAAPVIMAAFGAGFHWGALLLKGV
jgi:3-oxoacyl-[acyl-carrier-protein] synthase III